MVKYNDEKPKTSIAWATTIYEDIEKYDGLLINMHMNAIVSPLHDKDVREHIDVINGHEYKSLRNKKAHRHVMLLFPRAVGEVSFKYVLDHNIRRYGIDCVGHECIIDSAVMARYFAHMDNPEKAQYRKEDIIYYGLVNSDILQLHKKNKVAKYQELTEIIEICLKHNLTNMADVYRYFKVCDHEKLVASCNLFQLPLTKLSILC